LALIETLTKQSAEVAEQLEKLAPKPKKKREKFGNAEQPSNWTRASERRAADVHSTSP
jgi:hypothetical protein